MDIAPNLYKLAWKKNQTVREDLQNENWMRGLWRMQGADAMAEFINLWHQVQQVQFSEQEDIISWKWTSSGQYTAKPAYLIQCQGAYSRFHTDALWQARAEGKQKLHMWLALHNGALTADNLLRRNWPCNPQCSLCDQESETMDHISLTCSFARQVWHEVNIWAGKEIVAAEDMHKNLLTCWNERMEKESGNNKRRSAVLIIYSVEPLERKE